MALGEAFAFVVEDELMMEVGRLGEVEELLEETMYVGGWEEVLAASDVGNFLGGVIANHGEVIGGADVFSGENDIAEKIGIDGDFAMPKILKSEGPGEVGGLLGVETPGGFLANRQIFEIAASAGIERAFGAVGGVGEVSQFAFDFPASAETRIDHAEGIEGLEGVLIGIESVELLPGIGVPMNAEPVEIFLDGVVVFRAHAGVINVFEAEEELPLVLPSQFVGKVSRKGMSEMEQAGGTGSEAGDHF